MREARIIYPVDGPLNAALQKCIHNVIHAFGGATVSSGMGHWMAPSGEFVDEIVRIVDIAYEQTEENDAKLYDLAWDFLHANNQVEVYLRYGNGHVQMVKEGSCMDNGEFDWNALVDGVRHGQRDDLNDIPDVPLGVAI